MAIIYKQGDMFEQQVDAIVNTVNCVGVMGKGVALEFKKRWPENFKEYKKLCDNKQLNPGTMFIHDNGGLIAGNIPRYLINFPTKQHWRGKSKMEFIVDGLDDFVAQINRLNIKSVALPPLGCGNGGLPWEEVKALIEAKLSGVETTDFYVFEPVSKSNAPEFRSIPHKMTTERAILVKTIGEFEKYFGGHLTRISLQKIVYFLQALGVDYGFEFAKNQHGPYSERLKDVFYQLEKHHYIAGYSEKEPAITATSGAYTLAEEYLDTCSSHIDYREVIKNLALLIEGYESPYGMELLSSIHYLYHYENQRELAQITASIQSWNEHKNSQFAPKAIELAFCRLREDGLVN